MADQSLQAFQLGASLFDRAQTQQRLMEQFQLQAADQVMRQRQYDLQNKIQTKAYEDALKESNYQNEEYNTFQDLLQSVADFQNNPEIEAKMPTLPRFRSQLYNQQAIQIYNGLKDLSARAKIFKAKSDYDQRRAGIVAEMFNMGIDPYDPDTKLIKEDVFQKNLPAALARIEEKKAVESIDQDIREELLQMDKSIPLQERLKTARQKVEERKAGRTLPSERLKTDIATGAIADWQELFGTPDERTASRIKGNVLQNEWRFPTGDDGKLISGDYSTAQKSAKLIDELNKFEKTYGAGTMQKYVGIIDGNLEELLKRAKTAKTDQEKSAYSLLQRFQKTFNDEAFATSGKAVTQSEGTRLKAAIGDIKSNNFINDVNNFATFAAEDLYNTVDEFKTRYKITPEQVKLANELVTRYKLPLNPFGQRQQQLTAPTGNQPLQPASGFPPASTNQMTIGRFGVKVRK